MTKQSVEFVRNFYKHRNALLKVKQRDKKMTDRQFHPFEFDSPECAAIAHDLAIIQLAGADRSELNFSENDLEIIINIAKGQFDIPEDEEEK